MFADRHDAGRRLAELLRERAVRADVVVGLPRGGVPVAEEVAEVLGAPLDVIVVRKLGVPGYRELAMGALGEDGVFVLDEALVERLGVTPDDIERARRTESEELHRRTSRLRALRPRVDLTGRRVVVVDDGVATGSTARAACRVARAHGAGHVVLAVPVAPPGWERDMGDTADGYVAVETPHHFTAVGTWYDDFSPTTDDEVEACLVGAIDPPS